MHQFDKCWGIELLENLQNISLNMKQEYENYIANVDPDEYQQLFGWQKDVAPQFDPL